MSLIDDILSEVLPGPLKEVFGDSVTYVHKPSNVSETVVGILVDPSPIEGSYPGSTTALEFVKSDLFAEPAQGDEVTIGASTFTVFDVKSDDVGPAGLFVTVFLRKK